MSSVEGVKAAVRETAETMAGSIRGLEASEQDRASQLNLAGGIEELETAFAGVRGIAQELARPNRPFLGLYNTMEESAEKLTHDATEEGVQPHEDIQKALNHLATGQAIRPDVDLLRDDVAKHLRDAEWHFAGLLDVLREMEIARQNMSGAIENAATLGWSAVGSMAHYTQVL